MGFFRTAANIAVGSVIQGVQQRVVNKIAFDKPNDFRTGSMMIFNNTRY